ncbi:hypothetical protein [Shimia ponticola]|uniref:hypothetical protein n=1 Tax=Shimia ponticola TaxID=2582893 RepID=UPI0011BDB3E3|nr:hypothetical protein [Shimia ponticola]
MRDTSLVVIDVLDEKNDGYLSDFRSYLDRLQSADTDERLLENYTAARFNLEKQISVPVVFDGENGEIFGFSSVFTPDHWPSGVVRVGNRTWIDRSYRQHFLNQGMSKAETVASTKFFIELVSKYHIEVFERLKLSLAVITREAKGRNTSSLSYLAKQIETQGYSWTPDTMGYYQTVPNGNTQSCWQKIIFTEHEPGSRKLLAQIPRITTDVYSRRFLNGERFSD